MLNSKNFFFLKKKYKPYSKNIVYLLFSCKRWTLTKFVRLELLEETLSKLYPDMVMC